MDVQHSANGLYRTERTEEYSGFCKPSQERDSSLVKRIPNDCTSESRLLKSRSVTHPANISTSSAATESLLLDLYPAILRNDVEFIRERLSHTSESEKALLGERIDCPEGLAQAFPLEGEKKVSVVYLACRYGSTETHELIQASLPHHCWYLELARSIVQSNSAEYFDRIDAESWDNMASALKFAGINTLEMARSMRLKVCIPATQFHTWTAFYGTTIFDGHNNPEHLKQLDYVTRIREEAKTLEEYDIPLLLVFSESDMSSDQVRKMNSLFQDDTNIVVLSLETDLKITASECLGLDCLSGASSTARHSSSYMDSIRLCVAKNMKETLHIAHDLAGKSYKPALQRRLQHRGVESIFYSDIDNRWMRKPPVVLASDGLFTLPKMRPLTPQGYCTVGQKALFDRHMRHFRWVDGEFLGDGTHRRMEPAQGEADRLHGYFISGEAERNYYQLSSKSEAFADRGERKIWLGDNGCLYVASESQEIFMEKGLKRIGKVDLHESTKSRRNPDPFHVEAHRLTGAQLLRYYHYGLDHTWLS